MSQDPLIAEQLERQAVVLMESTIPPDVTCDEWRRRRSEVRATPCDHLHETTSRYDRADKQLTFLSVCHVCRTEQVIESVQYEPHFQPHRLGSPTRELSDETAHESGQRRDHDDRRALSPLYRPA
jgi:hypothetical protein